MGIDSKVGSITPGKLADMVLLRTDRLGFAKIDDLAERVYTYAGIQDIDSVWVHEKLQKKDGNILTIEDVRHPAFNLGRPQPASTPQ